MPDGTYTVSRTLPDQVDYADLGPDWAQRRRSTEHRTRRLVHQLEQLGHASPSNR